MVLIGTTCGGDVCNYVVDLITTNTLATSQTHTHTHISNDCAKGNLLLCCVHDCVLFIVKYVHILCALCLMDAAMCSILRVLWVCYICGGVNVTPT